MHDHMLTDHSKDPRKRLIAILVGAVFVPSLVLSCLAVDLVRRQTTARKESEARRRSAEATIARSLLRQADDDLARTAQIQAQNLARLVGPVRVIDERPEAVRSALRQAGIADDAFEVFDIKVLHTREILKQRL